jgi:hypothetical protein
MSQLLAQEASAVGDNETAKYWRQRIPDYEAEAYEQRQKLADLLAEADTWERPLT